MEQNEKENAIVEITRLEMGGGFELIKVLETTWKRWDNQTRSFSSGIITKDKQVKEWIGGKLEDIDEVPQYGKIFKNINVKLNPTQEVEHYSRAAKTKVTGKISACELSIRDKDFLLLTGALAENELHYKDKPFFEYKLEKQSMTKSNGDVIEYNAVAAIDIVATPPIIEDNSSKDDLDVLTF